MKVTIEILKATEWDGKAPRLKDLVDFINDNLPGYKACMEKWWGSFDRKDGRLRIPGKSRVGMVLKVYKIMPNNYSMSVLDHNPLESCRKNNEVVRWIVDTMKRENS